MILELKNTLLKILPKSERIRTTKNYQNQIFAKEYKLENGIAEEPSRQKIKQHITQEKNLQESWVVRAIKCNICTPGYPYRFGGGEIDA